MNNPAKGTLEGIHDILSQPLAQESSSASPIILITLLLTLILTIVWIRHSRKPLNRYRKQFKKAIQKQGNRDSAELAEELLQLLRHTLGSQQIEHSTHDRFSAAISTDEWRSTVKLLYRARYSSAHQVDLKPAIEPIRKILWCTKA